MLGQPKEKAKYLNIMFGQVVETATKETEGAKSRLNKNNQEVWEKHFPFVSGRILNMRIEESRDYGDKLIVLLDDMGERYQVQMPIESRYFKAFAMRVPNLKPQTTYCIKPYDFVDKENPKKRITGINIHESQDDQGQKIESYFTKEHNNGMPEFPESKDETEIKIWGIKVLKFLKEVVVKHGARFSQAPIQSTPLEDEEPNDLPFD